jgi:hypothetical protein
VAFALDRKAVFGDLSKFWDALLRKKAMVGLVVVLGCVGVGYVPFFVEFGNWLAFLCHLDFLVNVLGHILLETIGIGIVRVILGTPVLAWLVEGCVDAGIVVENIVQIITLDGRTNTWLYGSWHVCPY